MKLENKVFTFIGKRWAGKTMLASSFIFFYDDVDYNDYTTIFCNYSLDIKGKKIIRFKDFDLYKKLDKTDDKKKLLIFDEWWVNANSRNFASTINKLLSMFIFVSRKFNIDIVFITQSFSTIDINIRKQTDLLVEVKGWLPKYINFDIWSIKDGIPKTVIGSYDYDALTWLKLFNIKYDTKDLSGFDEQIKQYIK